jgi:hypothetical protein
MNLPAGIRAASLARAAVDVDVAPALHRLRLRDAVEQQSPAQAGAADQVERVLGVTNGHLQSVLGSSCFPSATRMDRMSGLTVAPRIATPGSSRANIR